MRIAVLASGSGSLLQAIIRDGIPVSLVVADRKCRALEVAADHGVEHVLVERTDFGPDFDRESYTARVRDVLDEHGTELVVMAGWGTILAPLIFERFDGRILNTHPALLPSFPGWHAVEEALAAGVKVTGCTIHVATPEVDAGPILAQQAVPVLEGDTAESLHERIKRVERHLYPATIRRYMAELGAEVPPPRRTALVSVWDKSGVVELCRELVHMGWEVLASGGTARTLEEAGVPVTEVAEVTGSGEMLGGRVKTLHPTIAGGILADRDSESHMRDLAERGISPIDLVVCNLYPFGEDPGVEMIDIGGPTMVRAAAKNHAHVGVVVDPADYEDVLAELRAEGRLAEKTRRRLAEKAFEHTSRYDEQIRRWFSGSYPSASSAGSEIGQGAASVGGSGSAGGPGADEQLPSTLELRAERVHVLRYGENPHQVGARYRLAGTRGWWDSVEVLGGKELSYLNVFDAEAAWQLVNSLGDRPAAVVVKHANPCGVAVADDVATAWRRANECDPVSAFGGIVAVNRPVTSEMAAGLVEIFTEVLVAPAYEQSALEILRRKKNLRILQGPPPARPGLQVRSIDGGLLVQTPDELSVDRRLWRVVSRREPTDREWEDLEFAWRVVAAAWSNAIVLAKDLQAVGIGCGQQNRRDAGRIAAEKAAGRAVGGVCASDAFFPFRDGLDAAAEAGVTAVIQPGGSVRDEEVIAAADEHGIAMVFTGERHFRH
ncbi:MAG: hypothetical protein KatS3mg008_1060 [Acidimicrobiales bacterium]|nr:MAG: hypothetical protein KatS3mg008_1060 [Acidimicrobiales bacterium]